MRVHESLKRSSTRVQLEMRVGTRAARVAPVRALEALSSRVLQATLKACTAPYLKRLVEDYHHWAAGLPRLEGDITPQEAAAMFLDTEATVLTELEDAAGPLPQPPAAAEGGAAGK